MSASSKRAFSLVELSIVLVILGLLVGGVLAGQSLIRASELRSIVGDMNRYSTAVYSFRDKYFGLPGDITNATSFWGDAGTTDCTTSVGQVFVDGTCNGDGDGVIHDRSTGTGRSGEPWRGWQQLALAGLIEGKYTGKSGHSNVGYVIGVDAPRGRISGSGWNLSNPDFSSSTNQNAFQYNFKGAMEIGVPTCFTLGCGYVDGSFLKPEEAWNIDTKIDDGKPGRGRVTINYFINRCSDTSDPTNYDANYLLSGTSVCGIYFRYL